MSWDSSLPRPLNILIVDGSAMTRAMLKRVTQLSGVPFAQILEAADGAAATTVLESEPIDVLFAGLDLPSPHGNEWLRAVNERSEWNHIRRIVICNGMTSARRRELAALKVGGLIEKPFRPEVVRDLLWTVDEGFGPS